METWKADVLYKSSLTLGEGAHWHPQWRKFLYVDIERGEVGAIDPDTREVTRRLLGRRVGTVVPAEGNRLIAAVQGAICLLDFDTGKLTPIVSLEEDRPMNRCNDGKCDAAGRLWVGTMHVEARQNEGGLYRYDGALCKVLEGTTISNGICWTCDHRTMYYIDSADYHIKAYDFDLAAGVISHPRVVVTMDAPAMPDGMCIDEEGMLWVAIWGGACVRRYDPASGRLVGEVSVDAPHVTSCAFGGEDMRQLFITTAQGVLFIAHVPYRGMSPNLFKFPL